MTITNQSTVAAISITKAEIESRPEKPIILPIHFNSIPDSLTALPNWLFWSYGWRDRWTKVPRFTVDAPGDDANITQTYFNPAFWSDRSLWHNFETVRIECAVREHNGRLGAGLILTPECGYVGIDLDDVRDRDTGALTADGARIVALLNTYTEISPSGTGLRLFVRGKKPGPRTRIATVHGVEIYDRGRWVSLTGRHLAGTPTTVQPSQAGLDALYLETFGDIGWPAETAAVPTSTPASFAKSFRAPEPGAVLSFSDDIIIHKALSASGAAGDRFAALWAGDTSAYNNDHSSADFALASSLAFWCGANPDPARIIGLMWLSGLRWEKWKRPDYLPRTVAAALARTTEHYGDWTAKDAEFAGIEIVTVRDDRPPVLPTTPPQTPAPAPSALPLVSLATLLVMFRDEAVAAGTLPDPVFAASDAAAEITRARNDLDAWPCNHAKHLVFQNRKTGDPWDKDFRCHKWHCSGCRNFLIYRETVNVRLHLGVKDLPDLFILECPPQAKAWKAMYRAIRRRRGGDYFAFNHHDALTPTTVITTACLPGSQPIAASEAVIVLTALLNAFSGFDRPISTSHAWKLPPEKKSGEFKRIGVASPYLTPELRDEIAAAHNAYAVPVTPHSDPRFRSLIRSTKYLRRDGQPWERDARDDFFFDLFCGEVIPRDVDFTSDPSSPQEDDSDWMDDSELAAGTVFNAFAGSCGGP